MVRPAAWRGWFFSEHGFPEQMNITAAAGCGSCACGWPEGTDTTSWNERVDKDVDADAGWGRSQPGWVDFKKYIF